jgi:hypothetical protein
MTIWDINKKNPDGSDAAPEVFDDGGDMAVLTLHLQAIGSDYACTQAVPRTPVIEPEVLP